jgi:hypothetical protein
LLSADDCFTIFKRRLNAHKSAFDLVSLMLVFNPIPSNSAITAYGELQSFSFISAKADV